MMSDVMTGLALAGKISEGMRGATSDSLIEYTKPTRVEPITLVDERTLVIPEISDIMQSLNSLFSGYYLQAVALSVNVGRVDVVKLLDKLNPQRSTTDNVAAGISNGVAAVVSMESEKAYEHHLPYPGRGQKAFAVSMEAMSAFDAARAARDGMDPMDEREATAVSPNASFGRNVTQNLSDLTNLSVGKMLEVEIESEGNRATFLVNVRLICCGIGPKELTHILGIGNRKITAKERFHAWRAGQLEFVRDLVLCQDLIDAHKRTLAKDNSGIYQEIRDRRKGNGISAIFSGQPSVATASNLIVMHAQTARELERELGGRLKDFKTREKVFRETYAMIIAVVDPEWDMVTFYHRSINLPSELNFKELKAANRNKGPDVSEILKAYQLGNSPSI